MTYEEFKQNFLPELLKIKSFKGKVDYANQNLQKIGSGSGRIVYDIDGEKVLKLAKNPKGVAQNEAEAGAGYYRDTHHIVAVVFDSADDDSWLIAEKAKKVNEKRIVQLTGIPSLNDLFYYLKNFDSQNHGRGILYHQDREVIDELNNNEFTQDLQNFVADYGQHPGDYGRPSTYGEVLHDGQPSIVLTDYGLNDEVYDTHYDHSKKKNVWRMVEMYNFADGNDDMLGDLPPQDAIDTRQSMWALMPYGVGDGDGVINERFLEFVSNNDKYPIRRILPSTPSLTDEFHNVVNNLGEVLEKVDDKKKFYNNLLELQNYLIRGKFYDREPLERESMELNEETPLGQGLERAYSDKVAKSFADKMNFQLNLGDPQWLGGGGYGMAYQVNNNRVLKITTDLCEVDAGAKTHRAKPKHLIYVDKIYKVIDPERPNKLLYALIEDFIPDRPVEKFSGYIALVSSLGNDLYGGLIDLLAKGKSKLPEFAGKTLNDFPEMANLVLTSNPEANINAAERQGAYEFMMNLYAVKQDLLKLGIRSNDYYEPKNLGYKNGILIYYDIGNCKAVEPQIPADDIITLEEDGSARFSTDDSIGRDNFPAYNNTDDGSPVQPNELPVNIFAEDLEYNHVVGDATQDKFQITERKMSYMPGSQAVEVKKKCRLAGNGSTSTACNQGDIGNLKFKSINEEVRADIPSKLTGYDSIKIINDGQEVGEFGIIDRGIQGKNHYITVDKIFIDKQFRGKNYANDAMRILFQYADSNNLIITLTPDNMWGASMSKLKAWYKSLGFVENKGKKKDFQTMQLLYRLPKSDLNEAVKTAQKFYRAVDKFGGKTVEFEPEGYYEAIDDEGNPIIKYDTHWVSEKPETAASYSVGGAVMGLYSMFRQHGKAPSAFHIYEINEKPDVDISHWDMGDFAHLQEVRYRRPVRGTYKGKVTINDDIKEKLDAYYEIVSSDEYDQPIYDPEYEKAQRIFQDTDYDQYLAGVRSMVHEMVKSELNEEIDASEAYRDEGVLDTMISGRKDVGIISFKYEPELRKLAVENSFGFIPIKQSNHNQDMNIIYRMTPRGEANAKRLYEIMKSHGGYVQDQSPEEAREIGRLLDYSDESINSYIQKVYGKKVPQAPEYADYVNMNENAIFAKNNVMGEAQLMSLQDLPFKQEVEQLGGKIYSVGGAVRDEFLGKESKDLDVLITGVPMDQLEQILSKYGRVDAVGKSFGVLKFKPQGETEQIDIAIPRTEKPSGEGGHKGFDVTSDHALPIERDLERRDFTINAVARDAEGNLVDPFGGTEDIKNKIIRVVNPDAFSDDPLRMLRAVQFASRFGFNIEPETMKMIQGTAERIKEIPAERVLTELDKILNKGNMRVGAQLLKDTGLFQQIFGFDLKQSTIDRTPFENIKTMGEFIYLLTRLLSNPSAFYKTNLRGDIDTFKEIKALEMAFSNADVSNPIMARSIASNMYLTSPKTLESQIIPEEISTASQELLSGKYPKSINDLAVNGNDLMALGLQGKEIGDTLKMMLLKIYADKIRNNKEELLSLVPKKNDVNEIYDYPTLHSQEKEPTWNINGQEVNINYFIEKYYIWNQGEYVSADKESVSRFLEDEYPQFAEDEKFKKDLLWLLTRNELLDENGVKRVIYSAVVLDERSKQRLIERFRGEIPEGWEVIAHHMTINMGELSPEFIKFNGMVVRLSVNDIAKDDKVLAVGVSGFETKNAKAHITLAVNRQEGGKPMMSNNLTNWQKLKRPLLITGKVTEVT